MTKLSQEALQLLGISRRDFRVYKALLASKDSSIRAMAEATGINRGSTYESIKRLSSTGLVTYVKKGKRKYYSAARPDKLQDLLNNTRRQLEQADTTLEQVVDNLKNNNTKSRDHHLTKFYEGYEGIALVLKDILSTVEKLENPEYYVYSSKALRGHLYVNFPRFKQRRIKLDIKVKVIAVGSGGKEDELSQRKWLDKTEKKHLASYTMIYANKVATVSLSEDKIPYAVVVEDEGVSKMQKIIFEQVWNTL